MDDCKLSRFQPQAVLSDDVCRDIELCWFCCAKINDTTKAQVIITTLAKLYPLKDFLHLKRARSVDNELQVLITSLSAQEDDLSTIQESLTCADIPIGPLFVIQVPKSKPLTRKQFTQSKQYWSCSFHEDKFLEKAINNECFSKAEIKQLHDYMRMARKQQAKAIELGIPNPVGAVVVSMDTGDIIAQAHTNPDPYHPLRHTIMQCIDQVATSQCGGTQQVPSLLQTSSWRNGDDCAISVDQVTSFKKPKLESYLCTGYDVFTTVEPCVMCSMALLHSRVRRVFYGQYAPDSGGLGSRYKIHCVPSLNHHFDVFCCNVDS